MEDGRAHMHVGVVSLFDAGPLRLPNGGIDFEQIESFVHIAASLGAPASPETGVGEGVRSTDLGRRLQLQSPLPPASHGAAAARRHPPAQTIGRPHHVPGARPRESRCGSTGSSTVSRADRFALDLQGPPLRRRRDRRAGDHRDARRAPTPTHRPDPPRTGCHARHRATRSCSSTRSDADRSRRWNCMGSQLRRSGTGVRRASSRRVGALRELAETSHRRHEPRR